MRNFFKTVGIISRIAMQGNFIVSQDFIVPKRRSLGNLASRTVIESLIHAASCSLLKLNCSSEAGAPILEDALANQAGRKLEIFVKAGRMYTSMLELRWSNRFRVLRR
jgi:hypothetical protein